MSQRPIVLLGDVGVGKTAFLKNLMLIEAAPEFERAICVYLDLGSQGALADDLRRFVLNELEHQLWDKYGIDVQDNALVQTLYAADLARFEQGIFSALRDNNPALLAQKTVEFLEEKLRMRDEHLRTALAHIASTANRQIIIVLDNSDQRTSDVQIETFAIAQELAKSWAALVFIAMRPETYLHLRRTTTTAAEAQRVFTIAPPRIEEVIRKRLRFALEIAEGRLQIKRLQSVTLKLGNFAAVVHGLLSGLSSLSSFFDNFFNGNVANAVQVVDNFIGSPSVNERRIINRGRYVASLFDLWPSVLCGRFSYYSPATTAVLNVFDVWSSNSVDHFLLPMNLGYLQYDGPHRSVDGFVAGNYILLEMQDWSFSTAAIEWALERASGKEKQLIERSAYKPDHPAAPGRFRITTTGAYYLSVWMAEYSYLEAMWHDTPVFDNATRAFLVARAADFDLRTRYERAVAFREYLTDVWNGSELRPAYFNWTIQVSRGQKNFDSLVGFIEQQSRERSSRLAP